MSDLFNVTLYGLSCGIEPEANGNCLVSEVVAAHLVSIDIDAFYLLYRPTKYSEVRIAAGGIRKDDNTYGMTFDIDTVKFQLSDFGSFQNNLLDVLRSEAKYIQVNSYDFQCFSSAECMPFEVTGLSHENNNSWNSFKIQLEKANADY
ncbi:MAG: hypothetical protein RBT61_12640 [Candidatus Kapabacteria bacterium]|jgi:hypothetical protein|nr:hypothetical protein [Candidatus Kapabacteria bacterium]